MSPQGQDVLLDPHHQEIIIVDYFGPLSFDEEEKEDDSKNDHEKITITGRMKDGENSDNGGMEAFPYYGPILFGNEEDDKRNNAALTMNEGNEGANDDNHCEALCMNNTEDESAVIATGKDPHVEMDVTHDSTIDIVDVPIFPFEGTLVFPEDNPPSEKTRKALLTKNAVDESTVGVNGNDSHAIIGDSSASTIDVDDIPIFPFEGTLVFPEETTGTKTAETDFGGNIVVIAVHSMTFRCLAVVTIILFIFSYYILRKTKRSHIWHTYNDHNFGKKTAKKRKRKQKKRKNNKKLHCSMVPDDNQAQISIPKSSSPEILEKDQDYIEPSHVTDTLQMDSLKTPPRPTSVHGSFSVDQVTQNTTIVEADNSNELVDVTITPVTPRAFSSQVQAVASIVSSTGLDRRSSLHLANDFVLRRLETQFQEMSFREKEQSKLQMEENRHVTDQLAAERRHQETLSAMRKNSGIVDDVKQAQNNVKKTAFRLFPGSYFQTCIVISLLFRFLYRNHDPVLRFLRKTNHEAVDYPGLIALLISNLCGCSYEESPVSLGTAMHSPELNHSTSMSSFFYYFSLEKFSMMYSSTRVISLTACWTVCSIRCLFYAFLLFGTHKLMTLFYFSQNVHHALNMFACVYAIFGVESLETAVVLVLSISLMNFMLLMALFALSKQTELPRESASRSEKYDDTESRRVVFRMKALEVAACIMSFTCASLFGIGSCFF